MAQTFKTSALLGKFDTRIYAKGVDKKAQAMKKDGENIAFNVCFAADALPPAFAEFAKLKGQDGSEKYWVTFKIKRDNCKWYTEGAEQPIEQPANEYLDGANGKMFFAMIEYSIVRGKEKTDPSGYYVNTIVYKEKPSNPFAGVRFENAQQVGEAIADQPNDAPTVF